MNLEDMKKKLENMKDDPMLKKANDYLSEGQLIQPGAFRDMFFANSFALPEKIDFYPRIQNYIKKYKEHIEEKDGCHLIPFGLDGKDMLDFFYQIGRHSGGIFAKSQILCISRVMIQELCAVENSRFLRLHEIPEDNIRMLIMVKEKSKENDKLSYNIQVFNALISDSVNFLTFIDPRFNDVSVNIGACKKRGKMTSAKFCKGFLICVDFVPTTENLKKCQALIMQKDPRDPFKPIMKMIKAVGNPEKLMEGLDLGKKEKVEEEVADIQLSECDNIHYSAGDDEF